MSHLVPDEALFQFFRDLMTDGTEIDPNDVLHGLSVSCRKLVAPGAHAARWHSTAKALRASTPARMHLVLKAATVAASLMRPTDQ